MSAQLIDGKAMAGAIREEIAEETRALMRDAGVQPGLGVILVGDDPASHVYVRNKGKASEEVGFHSETIYLPADSTMEDVAATIDRLNEDGRIHGILLQMPVPGRLDGDALILRISPDKDVDGLHPISVGRLATGRRGFVPCTPRGVVELLKRTGIPIRGRKAVIVGRSNLVGRPLSLLLSQKAENGDATVCVCHSRSADLAGECRQADILVAAIGQAGMITGEMIKPGAAVIDVGTNSIEDPTRKSGRRLVGDVDFEAAKEVAGWITPVPGGVGPMTIAMLLSNTLQSAIWAAEARTAK